VGENACDDLRKAVENDGLRVAVEVGQLEAHWYLGVIVHGRAVHEARPRAPVECAQDVRRRTLLDECSVLSKQPRLEPLVEHDRGKSVGQDNRAFLDRPSVLQPHDALNVNRWPKGSKDMAAVFGTHTLTGVPS